MMIGDIMDGGIGIIDIDFKLKVIKVMWIVCLIIINYVVKKYIDSFCKVLNININYLMSIIEILIENYGILKNFLEFYK